MTTPKQLYINMQTHRTIEIHAVSKQLKMVIAKDCKTGKCDFWDAGKFIEYHERITVNTD
jgi:hypothetical protein